MTALTEAQAARTELRASDAWKRWGSDPSTHVFKCGQHLDACIAELQPAPPPPPPATGAHVGNGYCTDLQGNRYSLMADTERAHYGGITVGFGNEIDAANFQKAHPESHGFGYQTTVESAGSNYWYGTVTPDVARQNGWVLKTSSGVEITNGYGLLMLDVGHPGYQKAWCDYVRARCATTGIHGKFLDNVTGSMMVGSWFHEGAPAKYPTEAAWQDAYVSMLAFQQQNLPGIYRLANAYAGDRLAWWKRIAPYVDGLMLEYYDGSDSHNACLAACVSAGKDPFVLVDPTHGQPGPDSSAGVALAAAFQAATVGRKGGGFGFVGVNMWREGAGSWTAAIT